MKASEQPASWRSLEERAQTAAFREALHREFPEGASEWNDPAGRRRFLQRMGAALALAGLGACTPTSPRERIVPYVEQPEEVVPGKPLFFATAFLLGGYAEGVLVESHLGRPTKVEGNPDHPASLGATSAFAQASVLGLYDPERSRVPRYRGQVSTWEAFLTHVQALRARHAADGGAGLRLLTGAVTSPTLGAQLDDLRRPFPEARWYQYEPVSRDHARAGLRQALGRSLNPIYHFEQADVVVSLDADFLLGLPGSVRYARDFIDRRRVRAGRTEMNRLYAVEGSVTLTGAMADHRLPLRPRALEAFARALAHRLGAGAAAPLPPEVDPAWLEGLALDLEANRGTSLVLAGETLPPPVHALVHALNDALGNVGRTLAYVEPAEVEPVLHADALRALVEEMQAGRVETLVMLGGNPVYTAPADLAFAEALARVPNTVHLSTLVDETSTLAAWHLPAAHALETWTDARAYDGTPTILQPLIAPLYEPCRSAHHVLAALAGTPGRTDYDLVRAYWRQRYGGGPGFDDFWQQTLRDGVVRLENRESRMVDGGSSIVDREADEDGSAAVPIHDLRSTISEPTLQEDATLDLIFRPDPTLWDGRFATNAWLQELPKPITKLVWDNAALVSPRLAARYGLANEEVVALQYRGRTLEAPVWIVPGHADGAVTLYLGHGRQGAGGGFGVDAYRLRTSDAPWGGPGLTIRPTGRHYPLVTTQHHHSMEGRPLVEEAPIARFRENPDFLHEDAPIELPSLYPEYDYPGYKWGMVIDLNACIGCNACIAACQAENNIPVVGKEEVRRGREMHWLRVDRYYKGDLGNPDAYFQPVPCMHCEKAPCEVVCPVYATVHDHEGLNVMVYNRCIGTRYCSNNCPYKVRRFNFLQYADWHTEPLKLQRNPDVTVRSRGVMEKCTYCLQRISAARIRAKREDRRIRDREVLTACQMACPTQAIFFGDLNDETAAVHALQAQPHNYSLLRELGTRPRTTYLARFRNPNEAMPETSPSGFEIGQEEKLEVEVGNEREGE